MEWKSEQTNFGNPQAVLRDGDKVICKVYLSPDNDVLRIAMPELRSKDQAVVKIEKVGIIDVRRKP